MPGTKTRSGRNEADLHRARCAINRYAVTTDIYYYPADSACFSFEKLQICNFSQCERSVFDTKIAILSKSVICGGEFTYNTAEAKQKRTVPTLTVLPLRKEVIAWRKR